MKVRHNPKYTLYWVHIYITPLRQRHVLDASHDLYFFDKMGFTKIWPAFPKREGFYEFTSRYYNTEPEGFTGGEGCDEDWREMVLILRETAEAYGVC